MSKTIVTSGASSGFGALSARALADAGHTVYAGMRDTTGRNGGHVVTGPTEAFTPEEIASIYDTNVLGTQRLNRAALPVLRSRAARPPTPADQFCEAVGATLRRSVLKVVSGALTRPTKDSMGWSEVNSNGPNRQSAGGRKKVLSAVLGAGVILTMGALTMTFTGDEAHATTTEMGVAEPTITLTPPPSAPKTPMAAPSVTATPFGGGRHGHSATGDAGPMVAGKSGAQGTRARRQSASAGDGAVRLTILSTRTDLDHIWRMI